MKKNRNTFKILIAAFIFMLALSTGGSLVFAQDPVLCTGTDPVTKKPTPPGCSLGSDSHGSQGQDSNGGTKINTEIINPLNADLPDIPSFILKIIDIVLLIAIPIIVLAIIYAGFLFVTAQGNTEKIGKAKKTLLAVLIGAAIILGARIIAQAVKGTVDEIKSNDIKTT